MLAVALSRSRMFIEQIGYYTHWVVKVESNQVDQL